MVPAGYAIAILLSDRLPAPGPSRLTSFGCNTLSTPGNDGPARITSRTPSRQQACSDRACHGTGVVHAAVQTVGEATAVSRHFGGGQQASWTGAVPCRSGRPYTQQALSGRIQPARSTAATAGNWIANDQPSLWPVANDHRNSPTPVSSGRRGVGRASMIPSAWAPTAKVAAKKQRQQWITASLARVVEKAHRPGETRRCGEFQGDVQHGKR